MTVKLKKKTRERKRDEEVVQCRQGRRWSLLQVKVWLYSSSQLNTVVNFEHSRERKEQTCGVAAPCKKGETLEFGFRTLSFVFSVWIKS